MAEKAYLDKDKRKLGNLLRQAREKNRPNDSMRKIAEELHVSNVTLSYFENGVIIPNPDTYSDIINVLRISGTMRDKIDACYMKLKKTPPPDVCDIVINNKLNNTLRKIGNSKLSNAQIKQIEELIELLIRE